MLDCKNALIEAGGDFAEAEKILKKKGLASADKRSGRATNQGSSFTKITESRAGMVELTCETDFVSKNDIFKKAGQGIADLVVEKGISAVNAEVEEKVKEAIAILKENMILKRIKLWELAPTDSVSAYLHNGGQIGVMVRLSCDSAALAKKEEIKTLGFDLALHAAAFSPTYLSPDKVDAKYMKEQEEIFTEQTKKLGKPDNVVAGIVKGKINKNLSQICFTEQGFVKDDKVPVKTILENKGKELGGKITLADYACFVIGQE
jgi:elongation factor Ts